MNISCYMDGRGFSASGEIFPIFSPSTGQEIGTFQSASEADVGTAIQSAKQGFKIWSTMTGLQRGRILMNAARLLRERTEELAQLEVLDTGKPISEALLGDIPCSADTLEYFAGLAGTLHGTHVDLGNSFGYTRREPLGVCAGIGAWNYPLLIAIWKSAPALACGNSMVFKPSELTPLTALKLAEIYTEAGVPNGVFNIVQGKSAVGHWLCKHPEIRKISLTGSVPTGKKVAENAASGLKAVTLELGGKSPLIIFGDTAPEKAADAAIYANFYTQGEVCSNGTRVFVEENIYKAFLDKLISRTAQIRVGDPFDSKTQMGALISPEHLEKVRTAIHNGIAEGAKLMTGGEAPRWPENSPLKRGNFITPAVFTECHDQMTLVREEIFGPVMSVMTFRSEEEVLERANDSSYGLAAGVFTRDLQRAHRMVSQLQAGVCWINNFNVTPAELPFGGYKASGIGRENGQAAIEHYSQLKTVFVEMGEFQTPFI